MLFKVTASLKLNLKHKNREFLGIGPLLPASY